MHTAALNTSGNQQTHVRALNAPMEGPAATISMSSDPQSLLIAGTTSRRRNSKNWWWIHAWRPLPPSPVSRIRPLRLATE